MIQQATGHRQIVGVVNCCAGNSSFIKTCIVWAFTFECLNPIGEFLQFAAEVRGLRRAESTAAIERSREMGTLRSLGFTRAGSLYYGLRTGGRDVYTVPLEVR